MPCSVPSSGFTRSMSSGRMTTSPVVCSESLIDAGKFRTEDFNQLVVDHQTVHDVALADEVGNECVFRLVVDLFRGTHLLDITLVHDNDWYRTSSMPLPDRG